MAQPQLTLKYDPLTVKHLGVSLYTQLPSVLSELVSNSYDADAESMQIELVDTQGVKSIKIKDDGHGMSFDELDNKYLLIGRNRRIEEGNQFTESKKRKVIGKKGLGKLSVFGICTEADIKTVRDGVANHFIMNLDKIEVAQGVYHPEIIASNEKTDEASGTEIILKQVKRKSPFDLDAIANSLAKKFTIFDELEVRLKQDTDEITLTNERKFSNMDKEFIWKLPSKMYGTDFQYWPKIKGEIYTLSTPVKDTEMRGIYLTSRGKIVNTAEFYGLRDNDQFHSYVTGYLSVDFIDDLNDDIIGTDRHSLIWENDVAAELKDYIQSVIKKIGNEWKDKRAKAKAKDIKNTGGVDIGEWKDSLPHHEKELADKIINPILEDSTFNTEKSTHLIESVIGKFQNQEFKNIASKISETHPSTEMPKFIELINDWKVIENKEMSGLAIARIEVIKQFEAMIGRDTKEVPTLHDFLKKFPWLLEPRLLEFQDEVSYSEILKKEYPESTLDEKNRRIDFLCSNPLGNILYVVEIKRSQYQVDNKALEQAFEYGSFLSEKYGSQTGFSSVVCYVIGGSKSSARAFRDKEKMYIQAGTVFAKTYIELLEQSKKFHYEFLQAHRV